jgi:membrane-associated phospholipid phosphatase
MQTTPQYLVRNSVYAIISALIICFVCCQWVDIPVASYFYHHPDPILTEFSHYFKIIFATKVWLALSIITLLFGWLAQLARYKKTAAKLFLFGISGILSFFIAGVIKVFLARYRPELYFEAHQYGFHFLSNNDLFNSMPSGHTTATMAGLLAIIVAMKRTWITIVLLLLVVLVALSRLIAVEHYCSDVIAGGYVGALSVYWTHAFLKWKR